MVTLGDIAFCTRGFPGLITKIDYDKLTLIKVYHGIQLSVGRYGTPWQSRSPRVVGNIHNVMKDKKWETP